MTRSARKTHHVVTQGGSALSRYQDVIVGQRSLVFLLYFEFCLLLGPLPGALGLTLRRLFWPRLFAACGRGTLFGRDITLRHPGRLKLGSNVVIGDNVTLDGRSSSDQPSVSIGNNAMIADDCTLTSKDGWITLGESVGLGTATLVQATSGCSVEIGDDGIIGPHCYIVGGGNYDTSAVDELIRTQPIKTGSTCRIEANVWIGAKVCVLDGALIGPGSIVAAGAVVNSELPPLTVCGGIPARVIKPRRS